MHREARIDPDYVILVRNNLGSEITTNASAGKYLVFGEGPIKDKLLKGGIQFDAKKMFLMANNYNFDEEKITTEAPLTEKQELLKKDVEEKRTASKKNDHFKPRKVATPGFGAPLSSNSSQESSSDDSSDWYCLFGCL